MNTRNNAPETPAELLAEFKNLVSEAEEMLGDSVSQHSQEAIEAMRERLDAAHERFRAVFNNAKAKVMAGAKCTDTAIRENPYQSLAIAAGVGLLVGVLLGRRSK